MSDEKPPERRNGERRTAVAPRPRERRTGRERRAAARRERTEFSLGRGSPEARITAVVAVLVILGLVIDFVGKGVVAERPVLSADTSVRAVFCPAAPKGGESSATVIAGVATDRDASIGIEPIDLGPLDLSPGQIVVRTAEEPTPLDVVGYGEPAVAAVTMGLSTPTEGAGAAGCSPRGASRWFFAEGSSTLGYDQRFLIYNPFPSEAVVRVRFYTPDGPKLKANLASVPVPARGALGLAVNDYLLRQSVLGASIETIRGRVVVWKAIFGEPEGRPHGGALTLGATATADEWYFPDGGVGTGYDERLSILNPGNEEALVTVSLITNEEIIQPPKLVELKIPPRRVKAWSLDEMVGSDRAADLGPVGVKVVSVNDVPIVVEQNFFVSTGDAEGMASEIGLTEPSDSWWVPPATDRPASDSLIVINPASEETTVSVTLRFADGQVKTPEELQGVVVPSAGRIRLTLARFTEGKPAVALLVSDVPVFVQRTSYSSALADIASVMGIALP